MAFSPPASLNHAFLFQPPKSPASIAITPASATSNDYFSAASRKRQRPDSRDGPQAHFTETPSWAQCPTPSDRMYESGYGHRSDIVNERYRLAGGFDTPSLQHTSRFEHLTVPKDDFRRRFRDDDMGNIMSHDTAPFSGPLARERNGVARVMAAQDGQAQKTWKSFAFGIVGRVFSFGSTVFRGFAAGGGQGYDLKAYSLVGSDLLEQCARRATPLPGSWLEAEFDGDFEQDSPDFGQQTSVSRPPNKRRQTDRDTWVMVGTPDAELGVPSSPKRKISSGSVPRSNLAARPQASRASSRRSIAPVPRRQSSYVAANGSPAQQPISIASPVHHSRRASFASPRSPQGRPSSPGSGSGYLSPEAERLIKRQAKQERIADKAMSNMSQRMQDMIRQAQLALGTRYSVEGDGVDLEDEGYVDDDL